MRDCAPSPEIRQQFCDRINELQDQITASKVHGWEQRTRLLASKKEIKQRVHETIQMSVEHLLTTEHKMSEFKIE